MGRIKEFDNYGVACRKTIQDEIKTIQDEIYADMIFKKEKSKIDNTLLLIMIEMGLFTAASIWLFDKLPSIVIALLCLMIACFAVWDASIKYQKYKIQ